MSWITKKGPVPHDGKGKGSGCELPLSEEETLFGRDSLWQCDECGQTWTFKGYQGGEYDPRGDKANPKWDLWMALGGPQFP